MRRLIAVVAVAAAIGGCAQTQIVTTSKFDPTEAAYINDKGANTINAQAFLRQRGGAVVTCAGRAARLIPVTIYATERMTNLYGTTVGPALLRRGSLGRWVRADPKRTRVTRR